MYHSIDIYRSHCIATAVVTVGTFNTLIGLVHDIHRILILGRLVLANLSRAQSDVTFVPSGGEEWGSGNSLSLGILFDSIRVVPVAVVVIAARRSRFLRYGLSHRDG